MFRNETKHSKAAVFLFLYFLFLFFTKNIFSIWKFTEIYPGRPATGRPGPGRPAAGRQGLICKKKRKQNCSQVPGNRPPGSRAAGLPGRPAGGRPAPPPLYKGVGCPSPSFALLKIQKKEKRGSEGEEG